MNRIELIFADLFSLIFKILNNYRNQ